MSEKIELPLTPPEEPEFKLPADIQPCPFCGSVEHLEMEFKPLQISYLPFIRCDNCGGQGPNHWDESEAIKKWNDRPETLIDQKPEEDDKDDSYLQYPDIYEDFLFYRFLYGEEGEK